ncbi:MAG: virulence protein RhuM/Fic/DOC family protein [Patescibacteria group bacterium]|nr:virulence protein RhuM/Fic/DOC family protein [Patescibacteria group bacterium]MDD4610613.1 virulence protein RhuM/Fic/DOC family protein [Patescibacteria group bacterium]
MPIKKQEKLNKGEIIIYRPKGGEVRFEVKLEKETVWLTQAQIAQLFNTERSVITKHLRNIFASEELNENSVCAKIAHTAADGKKYQTQFYNLDIVISVGYRVNSKEATKFRVWATRILKEHLVKGYTINKNRLLASEDKFRKLQETIQFLRKKSRAKLLRGQEKEIFDLLSGYSRSLSLLEKYDKNKIEKAEGTKGRFILEYQSVQSVIQSVKKDLISKKEASDIFGNEVNFKLESIIRNLYQTFSKKELYATLEEKSAHLLYLIIKDHPFTDGNKRIASFLFVYFLDRNDYLFQKNGERKINDNALTALALLIAESAPKEKEQMIALITQLIK